MTLSDIYKDVYARLNLLKLEHPIFERDILKAINDAIVSIRTNYINQGLGEYFLVTETFNSTTQDTQYPYLRYATLADYPLKSTDPTKSFVTALVYASDNTIADSAQTFTLGDYAVKGSKLYKAMSDISVVNTYTGTFDYYNYRNFVPGNGLSYYVGDIIKYNGLYYKVEEDFVSSTFEDDLALLFLVDENGDPILDGNGEEIWEDDYLSRVYWKEIGNAYIVPVYYPFHRINEMRIVSDLDTGAAFSYNGLKLYVSSNVNKLTVSYIPEWEYEYDMSVTLTIPDRMVAEIKDQAVRQLATKLGVPNG